MATEGRLHGFGVDGDYLSIEPLYHSLCINLIKFRTIADNPSAMEILCQEIVTGSHKIKNINMYKNQKHQYRLIDSNEITSQVQLRMMVYL